MTNETMIDVILGNDVIDAEEYEELFLELFNDEENRKYYEGIELSDSYLKALDCLFDKNLSVKDRIVAAINACYFCYEAFYFFKMTIDERDLYNLCDAILFANKGENHFKDLPEYEKIAAAILFDDISSLYMFRDNYHKAITALYTQAELDNSAFEINKIKLYICFENIEDYSSFNRFYELGMVNDVVSYLLYLCVLIKTLRHEEIAEVLMDMFHDYDETYDVIKARRYEENYLADDEIELAFDVVKSSIESIPNFYDILMDIIIKNNITPNILEN